MPIFEFVKKRIKKMSKVIRSLTDPTAVGLLRLSFDKKLRYAWRKCIISSPTLISELSSKFEFEDIILDKKPKGDLPYKSKNVYIVSPRILERVGQLKNSRLGILATLPIPIALSVESFDASGMLILDGIDDVGDLGTILRSAIAFNWKKVWITHSCADPFDPVCIRSSQGALFSLPYRVGSTENAIKHCRASKGVTKLKFSPDSNGLKLGMNYTSLSETFLPLSGSLSLLVQKHSSSNTTDFKSIQLPSMNPHIMPISTSVSSLLYILQSRYGSST